MFKLTKYWCLYSGTNKIDRLLHEDEEEVVDFVVLKKERRIGHAKCKYDEFFENDEVTVYPILIVLKESVYNIKFKHYIENEINKDYIHGYLTPLGVEDWTYITRSPDMNASFEDILNHIHNW